MRKDEERLVGELKPPTDTEVAEGSRGGVTHERGYKPRNPTPLDVQDLQPPKGDSAVQRPSGPKPGADK